MLALKTDMLRSNTRTENPMITQKELETCDLTHRHAGNGWVMVQDLDKEYCRISGQGAKEFGNRAYLAAKSCLTPTELFVEEKKIRPPIPTHLIDPLKKLREELKSGSLKVVSTHIKKHYA